MARPEKITEEVGKRLVSLRRGRTRAQFAAELDLHENTIGGYERGERKPDWNFLTRLRERAGVDINWVLTGEQAPANSRSSMIPPDGLEMVRLPRYDVRPSAGAGALVIAEDVSEHFAVGRDWLRRNLPPWAPLNAEVGILEGSGDSMWPTIHDGDLLMIIRDVDWAVVERGGVFVLTVDDRFLLKRLNILMNGDLEVISDNKAYRPETIPMAELEARVRIHGFVFRAVAPLRGILS